MTTVEDSIWRNLRNFVAFAGNPLGGQHLAEVVVQESLIIALAADRKPKIEDDTTARFYRILRRSLIDVYRRLGARSQAMERFEKARKPLRGCSFVIFWAMARNGRSV